MRSIWPVAGVLFLVGCGASAPPPTNRLASSEAAARSARELGADRTPNAALHLKLADEQIAQARARMNAGDNKTADRLLQRASADAELAVMLTKEETAEAEASKARAKVNRVKNRGQSGGQ